MSVFVALEAYAVVAAWMSLVWVASVNGRYIPPYVMLLAGVAAAAAHALWFSPLSAVASLVGGAVMFIALALSGAVTRTTTAALTPALVLLPVAAWVAFLPGLVAAGVVAALRLRKAAGDGYLTMMAGETLSAVGNRGGKVGLPDPSRMPLAPADSEIGRVKIPLVAFLILGVVATAGFAAVVA